MPRIRQQRTNTSASATLRPIAIVLLSVYLVGSLAADLAHAALHDHAERHTATQENDPCHRTVFHGDDTDGCDHRAHLTAPDQCKYSSVLFHAQQLADRVAIHNGLSFKTRPVALADLTVSATDIHQLLLRGPPLI